MLGKIALYCLLPSSLLSLFVIYSMLVSAHKEDNRLGLQEWQVSGKNKGDK